MKYLCKSANQVVDFNDMSPEVNTEKDKTGKKIKEYSNASFYVFERFTNEKEKTANLLLELLEQIPKSKKNIRILDLGISSGNLWSILIDKCSKQIIKKIILRGVDIDLGEQSKIYKNLKPFDIKALEMDLNVFIKAPSTKKEFEKYDLVILSHSEYFADRNKLEKIVAYMNENAYLVNLRSTHFSFQTIARESVKKESRPFTPGVFANSLKTFNTLFFTSNVKIPEDQEDLEHLLAFLFGENIDDINNKDSFLISLKQQEEIYINTEYSVFSKGPKISINIPPEEKNYITLLLNSIPDNSKLRELLVDGVKKQMKTLALEVQGKTIGVCGSYLHNYYENMSEILCTSTLFTLSNSSNPTNPSNSIKIGSFDLIGLNDGSVDSFFMAKANQEERLSTSRTPPELGSTPGDNNRGSIASSFSSNRDSIKTSSTLYAPVQTFSTNTQRDSIKSWFSFVKNSNRDSIKTSSTLHAPVQTFSTNTQRSSIKSWFSSVKNSNRDSTKTSSTVPELLPQNQENQKINELLLPPKYQKETMMQEAIADMPDSVDAGVQSSTANSGGEDNSSIQCWRVDNVVYYNYMLRSELGRNLLSEATKLGLANLLLNIGEESPQVSVELLDIAQHHGIDAVLNFLKAKLVTQALPPMITERSQQKNSDNSQYHDSASHVPRISAEFAVAAYGVKELIENYLSIKYATKEIISPLLPQITIDCYEGVSNSFPTIPEPIQAVATHEVTWIGAHFTANIVGLKSLHNQDYSIAKIVTLSSLNTGLYTFKHYAYQKAHKLMPNDIAPVESITDFTEYCWKPTITGAVLAGGSSASTAWMFGGVGIAKVAFDSSFGAFLAGYNCYQYSWQQYQVADKSYLEKYLPYIADIGVGIYILNTLSHIPTPANTVMKSIVAVQKGAMLLSSIVATDITTKAMVNLLPDEVEIYFDFVVDTFVDRASNFMSNIYSAISICGQARSYTEQEDLADL